MTDGDGLNTAANVGASTAADQGCPSCGEPYEAGDRFCEGCGHAVVDDPVPAGTTEPPRSPEPDPPDARPAPSTGLTSFGCAAAPPSPARSPSLTPTPPAAAPPAPAPPVPTAPCSACGGGVGTDGYCDECGRRAPVGADHSEDVLDPSAPGPVVAGVSDRGHRRRRNEDAFAFGRTTTPDGAAATVLVVADGVASVPNGDTASRVACDVAVSAGCESLAGGDDLDVAGAYAAAVARRAVAALAPTTGSPPACTYVAAVVAGDDAVVGWVGDSRAYWLAPGGESSLLTEDDSWATEMIAAGLIGADQAFDDPRAHVITRWLAADAPEVEARSVRCRLAPGGALLLCSDGVWNHVPHPDTLADVLDPAWLPDDVHAGAAALVQAALDDGGSDNATAVLLSLARPPGSGSETEEDP